MSVVLMFYSHADLGDSGGVFRSIQSAKAKWEKIGLGLGLSCSTLDQIRSDKHNEPGQCLYATLKAWINSEDKLAEVTWRALIRALAQVGETALAERLKAEKREQLSPIMKLTIHIVSRARPT